MHSAVEAGSDTWLLSDKLRTLYMPGHICGILTFPVTCSVHRTFPSSNLLSFCLCYQTPSPFLSLWCNAVSSSAGTFSRTQGKRQLMSNRWLLYYIEGHSTDMFGAQFTCVAHGHAQFYNMMCGDSLPVWLTGWPALHSECGLSGRNFELSTSQEQKYRCCMGLHGLSQGQFMAVEMCAVAWAPIEAGCFSDVHIFQLHLVLYQIVCVGPGNVPSTVFSEELYCGCLNDNT